MKTLGFCLMYSALFAFAVGCGKDNKSGKSSNSWNYANPYSNGYGSPVSSINSPYSYGGISVNQVIAENPCVSGYGGFTGMQGAYSGQRIPIQVPLTSFPTVIPPNDVYVGVTSYGDVGVLVGTAPGQPPLFVGYLCPRAFSPNGQGQLLGIKPATYSNCLFKPIQAATVIFPGGASADFRMLDFGSSTKQKFSFCR